MRLPEIVATWSPFEMALQSLPQSLAFTMVGTVIGLGWGMVLGLFGGIMSNAGPAAPPRWYGPSFLLVATISSGLVGGLAGRRFGMIVVPGSPTMWTALGVSTAALMAAWAGRRLARILWSYGPSDIDLNT